MLLFHHAGWQWASSHWTEATWRKVPAVAEVLSHGFNVILSDVDVMWMRDPLPYFLSFPYVDLLVSLDLVASAQNDTGLEQNINPGKNMNTGVYFARSTASSKSGAVRWQSACLWEE